MMFNGLMMCGDSDTSDFTKESAGTSRAASSACSEAGRAHYYHNKLLATTQILKNKEETVRVQTASLSVAEARIETLTGRCTLLRNELDHKTKELQTLKSLKTHKIDASPSSHTQVDNHNIINALQNNLSVIEELYRECFYEAAKQESLIDMLRQCCIEMRAMDRDKADQIGSLQNVINTQRWSLDKCQDISLEVDNLKSEISNFLNSSNNDSGMWEQSSVPGGSPVGVGEGIGVGLGEELQDILHQLLRLRELLTTDSPCELEEENKGLKQINQNMETQIDDLKKNIFALEARLSNKTSLDQKNNENMENKEKEADCTCELQEENRNLKLTNKHMETQISDLQKKICDLELMRRDIDTKDKELQTVCKSLKTQLIDACSSTYSSGSQSDCTCHLEEENRQLKLTNEKMEIQISDQRKKISDLEMMLSNNNSLIEEYKVDIAAKEIQFVNIKQQLSALEKVNTSRTCDSCASLTIQLQQTQEKLNETVSELRSARAEWSAQHESARRLQRDLDHAALLIQQSEATRDEVSELRAEAVSCRQQVSIAERRAAALEADLWDARKQLALVDNHYSEKVMEAQALERELERAHDRGAALCEETRRAVTAVRRWAARVRTRHREQEQKMKEKTILLKALEIRLNARQHDTELTSTSERDNEPSCSKCVANRSSHISLSAFPPPCVTQREQCGTSASEMVSCSSASPVPPKRLVKKKITFHCGCSRSGRKERRVANTEPATSTATTSTPCACLVHHIPARELSPEELYTRVEHLNTALADTYRRWTAHNNNNTNNINNNNR